MQFVIAPPPGEWGRHLFTARPDYFEPDVIESMMRHSGRIRVDVTQRDPGVHTWVIIGADPAFIREHIEGAETSASGVSVCVNDREARAFWWDGSSRLGPGVRGVVDVSWVVGHDRITIDVSATGHVVIPYIPLGLSFGFGATAPGGPRGPKMMVASSVTIQPLGEDGTLPTAETPCRTCGQVYGERTYQPLTGPPETYWGCGC